MAPIHLRTAAELSSAYASGELSPVQVTRALIERIEAWEPRINAMYRLHRDAALEQAHAADARWRQGRPLSPLDGVPVTIKENIYTRGDPAPIGTRANEDAPPQGADAPAAARVREAGCVILGKTTMRDFGMLSSGLSSLHGVTRNPWRLDRNPSGSSSGAGAAAVAGYAPLHLGTDIGGSVRLPATHCGIFALKPSLGRVPVNPPYMGRVVGPMTRAVGDAALLMSIIARPDARDYMSLPYQEQNFASLSAAEALASAGCAVESIRSFLTEEMLDGTARFFEARSYNDLMQLPAGKCDKGLPFIAEWCSWRAAHFSGRDVMQAYNFILSPASPILPYEAELPAPGNDPRHALPHIAFTVPYNMSEQPAASINWTCSSDGLPIGVQVIGKRFDDTGVLRLSALLEELRPKQRPWPELS